MKFKLKVGEKEYEVEIKEDEEKTQVRVGGKDFFFKKTEKVKLAKTLFPEKEISKSEILAPISGQILEIFVKEGDFVKKEQKLLILSAMKMENEILAEKEGKIKKIFVKKGEIVKKDQKLIEIE